MLEWKREQKGLYRTINISKRVVFVIFQPFPNTLFSLWVKDLWDSGNPTLTGRYSTLDDAKTAAEKWVKE